MILDNYIPILDSHSFTMFIIKQKYALFLSLALYLMHEKIFKNLISNIDVITCSFMTAIFFDGEINYVLKLLNFN